MSGSVECPVEKYGSSSEFGDVLDFIQRMISNDTLRRTFNIPHLVMVGRQNMAKTTLINRLIGRYLLPMRRNETANTLQARTTYPIILNLRKGDKTMVEVKCETNPNIGGTVEDPTDDQVENFLTKVAEHLPREEGTPISKTPVNVTLQGPNFTTLTLVDLPGAHFANDDQRMNHVTQELVLDYIKKNTKSIIVIVSEVGDPTGDSAINLVMQQAADFRCRTICALTKPDRLRDTDDMGKKVATNQSSFTLEENRFIVLRGKDGTDSNEKDWDVETTRMKEKAWFAGHLMYADIQHLCGIDRLMDTMISLLAEKMITEIPILVREMKEKKKKVEEELKELAESEVPETSAGKGGLLMKLKHSLIKQLETLLFNNTLDIEGGEKVRKLFKNFQTKVLQVNPLDGRDDEKIRQKQRKLEGVSAPLGDSSENNQLLQKLLYEKYTAKVRGSDPFARERKIPSPVDQLVPIFEKLVDDVEKTLRQVVQGAIDDSLSKFPTLKQAVEAKVVNKIFDRKREQTTRFLYQFLEMQKRSIDDVFAPVPLPEELTAWDAVRVQSPESKNHPHRIPPPMIDHPSMTSKTMNHMKYLSQKLHPETLMQSIATREPHTNYKEAEEMKKIKLNVVRCFNVLKMNVCDTVPRCILHFFITQLVEDLSWALETEDLDEFLLEKQEIQEKRNLCRAQYNALEDALPRTDAVLNKLLRMRKGTPPREASRSRRHEF